METCQCGHSNFVDSPLLHVDSGENHNGVSEVYSRIAHRTEEVETIYRAWTKVERMSRRIRSGGPPLVLKRLKATAEERKAQYEKEFYDAMTEEGKAWHDAAGRWPERFNFLDSEEKFPRGAVDDRFHLNVSLRLKMCTSCGASTIYSNIEEHNRCIDALLPLAHEKLASVVAETKAKEQAKESAKHERRIAEERVNELRKELADAEQAFNDATQQVGDGTKNLSDRRTNFFNPRRR